MGTEVEILGLTPSNLPAFGEVLHQKFLAKYKDLWRTYNSSDYDISSVVNAISDIYVTAGLSGYANIESKYSPPFRIGDILELTNGHIYSITGYTPQYTRTFPAYTSEDEANLEPRFVGKTCTIRRPSFLKIDMAKYKALVKEVLPEEIIKDQTKFGGSFKVASLSNDSTHLQIGDLIFNVDPIQISFTTQNGYQYYPTIRTNGNPKLATDQQIKNMNVVLIFPNEDAINYQLIPLYAMYRRTPFVNIKNRDISKFYSDIVDSEGYVPVALESIQIQSIEGFPNSLQATVSLLPFEPGLINNGSLRALKSFDDVFIQQQNTGKDVILENMINVADAKMQDETSSSRDRFKGLTSVVTEYTSNFRESFPFRAFYQSLIAENKVVRNEHGEPEQLFGAGDNTKKLSADISFLAPNNRDNFLHYYNADANRSPVILTYDYITVLDGKGKELRELREIGKYVSEERINKDDERLTNLKSLFSKIQSWQGLSNAMFSAFHNMTDALRTFQNQYGRLENLISTILVQHGWNTVMVAPKTLDPLGPLTKEAKPGTILNFIYRSILHSTNILPIWTSLESMKNAGKADFDMGAAEVWGIIGKNLVYNDADTGEISQYGIRTVEGAFKSLWDWVKDDSQKKMELINILEEIALGIKGELTSSLMVVNASDSVENSTYAVKRLPIRTVDVKIDNQYDVITSWSLTYANKFVPIYLLAYKYPFYQHLGSEDATLSLAITSVPSDKSNDLKTKLAELSDKMYDSVKIITHAAPDLYTWLDPRIRITVQPGNIFNAFGINKVILNSSNSANIQGQPDSWNTVVNLTQANFSIDQYHSIDSVASMSVLESLLANLIPRIIKDDKGLFQVRKFSHPTATLSLDDILTISFLFSKAGIRWWRKLQQIMVDLGWSPTASNLETVSTEKEFIGEELLAAIAPQMKLKGQIDPFEYDQGASSALQSLAANNEKFSNLLSAIIKEYDGLLERQGAAFENLIGMHKNTLSLCGTALRQMGAGAAVTTGIGAAVLLTLFVIPGGALLVTPLLYTAFMGYMASVGYGYAEAKKDWGVDKIRDSFGGIINQVLSVYKKEMLMQLTHAIMKDPPLRKRLFCPDIVNVVIPPSTTGDKKVSTNVEQIVKDTESFNRVNCYKDFDVPIIWTIDGRTYRASPDFYLYNFSDPDYYAKTYVRDNTERIMKTGKMGIQLALIEHKNLLDKYNNILEQLEGATDSNINAILNSASGIGTALGYTNNLQDSQLKIAQLYRISTFEESEITADQNEQKNELKNTMLDPTRAEEIRKEFERINADLKKKDPKLYESMYQSFSYFLGTGTSPKIEAQDLQKLNLVWTARMKCLLEIIEMSVGINSYFAKEKITTGNTGTKKGQPGLLEIFRTIQESNPKESLTGASRSSLEEMNEVITGILGDWRDITTGTLSDNNNNKYVKTLKSKFNKGLYNAPVAGEGNQKFLSLPSINVLESELYNKIGYYIRLNTALSEWSGDSSRGQAPKISLENLPELQMLDTWNVRNTESTFRQLEIEQQYLDSLRRQKEQTLRLFPTFKVYFIEEDTGRSNLLDDYYAYNAVQSIEISKSKTSSSTVAVLRLSNLTGTITDRLSIQRERSDFMTKRDPFTDDEAFFGTLDVKPGTKVQIKMGYAADDRYLPTVFSGRILEMNVGPTTEIICQSYGAQLQHKIYTQKFGFFASQNEYGDIVSALLDVIPGLENLGKKDIITFGLLNGFTGRELGKLRKSLFDNYLLTNLLGKLTADIQSSDNPRDENIYLPFNLALYPKWKPRFDWVVYNQSVWNTIQEICLYTMNTVPVIKQYNNDPISNRNEQRETLVVGNKSGYYKFTDALSFSSLDTVRIEQSIRKFKDIIGKGLLKNDVIIKSTKINNGRYEPAVKAGTSFWTGKKGIPKEAEVLFSDPVLMGTTLVSVKLKPSWIDLWTFLSDPVNVNIIKKRLTQVIDLSINRGWQMVSQGLDRALNLGGINSWHANKCIQYLTEFIASYIERDPVNVPIRVSSAELFAKIITHMTALNNGDPNFWDLSSDEFYGVTAEVNNVDPSLCNDPRYRKIQQHYFVSDSTNLINNGISLNANFANMINLYYLDEPQFINGIDGVPPEKWDKLNVWTIKAFGDIKDEHLRPLDTFQKNIDPWWFDIREKQEMFFKGYRKLDYKATSDSVIKTGQTAESSQRTSEFQKYVQTISNGPFNLHTPDWRFFPSYQIVGVNLLKSEVAKMYRGSIQIVGDCSIEPLDIIHLEDYINDMHGAVEVEEVIHTFTPDRGLITTITPSLITYDRDPIQQEDVGIINRIYNIAQSKAMATWTKVGLGAAATILGSIAAINKQFTTGGIVGGLGIFTAYSGLKGLANQGYHKFLYEQMGNILGRDVINFTTLIYHGSPYMCGFDGVDYTSLKTLMMHKAENVENLVTRISAFGDEFAASIYTNFNPADFTMGQAILNKSFLSWLMNYPTHGRLNDAFTVWDRLNPLGGG